jgi:hypothetical protein
MRKYAYGLGALVAPTLIGGMMASGCSDAAAQVPGLPGGFAELCGPCGTIASGDVGISGDARLDGFFKALSTVQNVTGTIKADFDGNIRALADTFGVTIAGEVNAAAVGQLVTAIEGEISANVQGSLTVDYQPPRCQANVNVAFEAQAKCEVKGGCTAEVTPGELRVACEGKCSGGCTGECTGDLSCEVTAPSIQCSGQCEGACNLEAGGECGGTCKGECDGTCSVQDAMGNCQGQCDGDCTGTCELTVAAQCSGTCTGKCLVDQGDAACTGEVSCRGSCDAECSGGCEGNFEPPSARVDCDATADCQASAKAEANASLECTPPQVNIDYGFAAGVNAAGRAEFAAKLTELKVRGVAIVQGAAKYGALINGRVNGEVVFNPSPVAALQTSISGFANASAFADLDVTPGKITCALPAVAEAVRIAGSLATGTAATLTAQADFVTAFTTGFSS